ncbi:hypothetical protein HF086_006220 [Spodoptera exigua]|uniref:Uncharacterized protein n=1 Tax=Spodoptera exigua TaxID=7107 RepID=A0A922SMV9_SPOEX|nr:hypothetical protein HF086_006220 [Spodoptera exigua]
MATMTDQYGTTGTLTLKWDPRNLEIRTMSVERTLEPLVLQVTTLVNSKDRDAKKKRRAAMSLAAREFSEEPCASQVRGGMVRAARALLCAVTRLLILADMVDVENDLDKLKSASSQSELLESARQFGRSASELAAQAAKRQRELKEPRMKDELAAARATGKPEQSAGLERAIENMCRKTRDLRRQLRKAVVDHVSDRYV